MASHNDFGEEAEELACRFLAQKGYILKDRNWRYGKKELDIVAEYQNELIVVEVKARTSDYYNAPQKAVDKKKQKNTVDAANQYILQHEIDLPVRYDIVAVVGDMSKPQIEHIEEAFIPML